MNNDERNDFYIALNNLHDNNPNNIKYMLSKINLPDVLCRFRNVTQSSLEQLQENKVFYSSADHYDDPFDTYLRFDHNRIKMLYSFLSSVMNDRKTDFNGLLKSVESQFDIDSEQFISALKQNPLDFSKLQGQIINIRNIVQKTLFSVCFCEDEYNETLWLKYASNYCGYVLLFRIKDEETYLCGKEDSCKGCRSLKEKPTIYPVYYSDEKYDATSYGLACLLYGKQDSVPNQISDLIISKMMWEAERISLIKKKCHEYDKEWRMLRPTMMPDRSCIKMRPYKIILGLRMPAYERCLVVSAAKLAKIGVIEELYINENDELDSRPI